MCFPDKIMAKLDKKLQSWFVVCPNRLKREIENFVNEIIQTGTPMGFVINHPYMYVGTGNNCNSCVQIPLKCLCL